jgi:hypothetical protein
VKARKATIRPAIVAIRRESARIGWPLASATCGASDLDHDERAINAHDLLEPLGWVVRPDGTHITTSDDVHGGRRLTFQMVSDAFGVDQCRFYVWDGSSLIEYPSARVAGSALTILVREIERDPETRGECAIWGES